MEERSQDHNVWHSHASQFYAWGSLNAYAQLANTMLYAQSPPQLPNPTHYTLPFLVHHLLPILIQYTLLSQANDATRRPQSSITRGLTQFMSALTQIIRASMHHDRASHYALGPNQLDHFILLATLGIALCIGLKVTEIANVTLGVFGGAVGLGERVDCGWHRQ